MPSPCLPLGYLGLKWGLLDQQPYSNACTFTDPDWCIHIFLNANSIWPLLLDEYSESEKVGIRVKLATTILHELSVCSPALDSSLLVVSLTV